MTDNASMLAGVLTERARTRDEEAEASSDRLASTLVRRMCNGHNCSAAGSGKPPASQNAGPCLHRNHRRDLNHLYETLAALDLTGGVARAEDYEAQTPYHSLTREEASRWGDR